MKKILIAACLIGLVASCKKLSVDTPSLTVATDKVSYKVGDTVRFVLTGQPDYLTFYSGEQGFNYLYKDRVSEAGTPRLVFSTYQQNVGEAGTLTLLASTNFTGMLDTTSVKAATWTDITSRATLSTGADNTASGTVNLSDFLAVNKPLFLAYRYTGYQHATLKQPTWTIRTFSVSNLLADSSVSTISNIDQIGWQAVDFKNTTVAWAVPTTGVVSINGTGTGSINTDNDDWIISKPLEIKKAIPNVGVNIKTLNANSLTKYNYVYKKAGTYTVTFVGINNTVNDHKSVVQQLTLTITP